MQLKKVLVILLTVALFSTASADPEADFRAANAAAKVGDYQSALDLYDKILKEAPTNSTLWNAGNCAYLSGDANRALKYWSLLKESDPLDWRVRAKLIQAYAVLKNEEALKQEREELLALQKSKPELFEQKIFCREQFQVGETKVMAFETFEMVGPRGIRYIFYVLNKEGKIDYRLSLGSYDETNAMSQEMKKLPEGDRYFHLDGYYNGGKHHKTFGFFPGEPSYKSTRSMIVNVVGGKAKALSSSGPEK